MAPPTKVDHIEQTIPTDTDRMEAESMGSATFSSITYPSGIVVSGPINTTSQPNRLRVRSGSTVSWNGGFGKIGMAANGTVPSGMSVPWHTNSTNITSHQFSAGDRVLVMSPYPVPDQFRYINEAVLIECESSFATDAPLHASWPTSITGFTSGDADDFLDDTHLWIETRGGWTGRYGHPALTMPSNGEPGYGGAMSLVTAFGAMLMCSDLSSTIKQQVQTRLLLMGQDLERFAVNYDADGGHCNGRYILWLIRRAIYPNETTRFTSANFSENQQIYRNGSNQIAWRFNTSGTLNPSYEYCCTINRWMGAAVCAKLATFLGASASDWVAYTISYMTAQENRNPAWQFSMSPRLATIFAANKATIGY